MYVLKKILRMDSNDDVSCLKAKLVSQEYKNLSPEERKKYDDMVSVA